MPAVAEAMERAEVDWRTSTRSPWAWGRARSPAFGSGSPRRARSRPRPGLPLRRVSSLAALAAGIDSLVRLPLIDARRGEVFAALYEGEREFWPPFASRARRS